MIHADEWANIMFQDKRAYITNADNRGHYAIMHVDKLTHIMPTNEHMLYIQTNEHIKCMQTN